MTRKNGPGDYTVEVNPKKPKNTVIVTDTKRKTVEVSERGVAGPIGPVGPTGPRGTDGTGLINGSGVPTNDIGQDGELFLDLNTGNYYGPKVNGAWPLTPIPALSNTKRFVFNQPTASATWNITHALGGRPSVTIVDSAGTAVVGEVVYNSDTSITVLFSAPFSGQAYLT